MDTEEKQDRSTKIISIIVVVVLLGIAGYYFRGYLFTSQVAPAQNAPATPQVFTPEINKGIDKFIFNRIAVLSPVAAATGTKFTVSSIEHTGPGETQVVYSDTTATYTAKGVFSLESSKNLNIVSFDLVPTSTPVEPLDEGLQLAEDYIKAHLSELSPEKEVLGGKFYITKITFENAGNAVVEYEDGHIALRAHVSFMVDGGKNVEVLKWEMLSTK